MAITSANQLELLQTAEAVAREKMIDPELVIEAMEESLARAAKSRYGSEMDIRVAIDRKTGKATFTRVRTVVDEAELENYQAEFTVEQAKQYLDDPKVGDVLSEEVPPVEMGRIAAQSAKQVILQKVREAERDRQFEEFKDRAGTIINGQVKREEYGNVIVDVGTGEAILRRNEKIGRESYRPNDRIRCYIKEVRREQRGPQIFLSRTAPEFMAELFKMEVPEIYDGIIEIKAVARDPGSRAKIAVISYDNSIDPVGACVGMRGSRDRWAGMSETDSFIEEVTEEVRRDRLYGLLKRWGWAGILFVLIVVGGAAWNEWSKAQARAAAEALGDGLYAALETEDADARLAALAEIGAEGGGAAIAAFLSASDLLNAGRTDEAIAALQALATDPEVPGEYRSLASLKALIAGQGSMDEAERRLGFEALAQPGSAFRMVAREQIALSYVAEGDAEAALAELAAIAEDAETGQAMRDRAQGLIVALGGELAGDAAGN